MNFSSVLFIFGFLPVFVIIYLAAPHARKNLVLLIGSYAFYIWGTPVGAAVLLVSSVIDHLIVEGISKMRGTRGAKRLFILGVAVNLGLLFYFKYSNFIMAEFGRMISAMGLDSFTWQEVVFPLGISFFIFHKISYLADVYSGAARKASGLVEYLTYTGMFPKLLQGPIVRWQVMSGQMSGRSVGIDQLHDGLVRLFVGLGKKVLIADMLGTTADAMFAMDPSAMGAGAAWLGSLCYTLQIYFDFSGYSDMAIGLGMMLGFRIEENFNRPYMALNFTDFWRRWHITLSGWFRQYLYIPLGGNRVGRMRLYLNLWVVFLVSGLWHGANWTFILWGAYHGAFLVIDRLGWADWSGRLGRAVNIGITFFFINMGWVLFRSPDIGYAMDYIARMFGLAGGAGQGSLDGLISPRGWLVLSIALLLSFFPEGIVNTVSGAVRKQLGQRARLLMAEVGALVLAALALAYIVSHDFRPYIYFTF